MTQKILRVGTSAAVTIPKKALSELGIKIGDQVSIDIDKNKKTVSIKPTATLSRNNIKITELTLSFIDKYRSDLVALSRK